MRNSENSTYSEGANQDTYALLVAIGSLILLVAGFFVNVSLFIVGLLGIPVASVLFGVGRYSKIFLTGTTLYVGKHALPLKDIDKTYGVLTEKEAADVASRRSTAPTGTGKDLVGGAYGKPLWMSAVVIRLKDGNIATIATQNRRAFTAALKSALGSPDAKS